MGQQEVYDFLMKHPDSWYTSKQISEQLAVSIGSVTMSLKKLRKTNIIKFRNTGKRNTFQYMVQSEPAKLAERKIPMMEQAHVEPQKIKVKIKPKIVHQHTYLGGQTFYGVIRPAEEVSQVSKMGDDSGSGFSGDDSEDSPRAAAKRTVRRVKTVKRSKAKKKKSLARRVSSARMKRKAKPKTKRMLRKAPRKSGKKTMRRMRRR